jgi:hypothetical protein
VATRNVGDFDGAGVDAVDTAAVWAMQRRSYIIYIMRSVKAGAE